MSLGERLLTLRKEKKLSQQELALKAGIHQNVLGRYERDETSPSIDIATNLSNALGVSLDYLVGNTAELLDKGVTDKILQIQSLPAKDREHIIYAIDNLLASAKVRLAYK